MAGERWPDEKLEKPKPKQISISFPGDIETPSDEEFSLFFRKARNQAWEAVNVLEKQGGWERVIKLFKENHPQYFKGEGLYSREDTQTVTVVARWKEKGEWHLIPLFWKVEKGGEELSLERIPYLSYKKNLSPKAPEKTDDPFKDSVKLESENHRKVEDLIRKFVKLIEGGKLAVDEREIEIILDPQEENITTKSLSIIKSGKKGWRIKVEASFKNGEAVILFFDGFRFKHASNDHYYKISPVPDPSIPKEIYDWLYDDAYRCFTSSFED
jgi:hypothetical protein